MVSLSAGDPSGKSRPQRLNPQGSFRFCLCASLDAVAQADASHDRRIPGLAALEGRHLLVVQGLANRWVAEPALAKLDDAIDHLLRGRADLALLLLGREGDCLRFARLN